MQALSDCCCGRLPSGASRPPIGRPLVVGARSRCSERASRAGCLAASPTTGQAMLEERQQQLRSAAADHRPHAQQQQQPHTQQLLADLLQQQQQQGGLASAEPLAGQAPPQQPPQPGGAVLHAPPAATAGRRPRLDAELCSACVALIGAGRCEEADAVLWASVMGLWSLAGLADGLALLAEAQLLRPGVLVALLVQLGKLATRAARRDAAAQAQAARGARLAGAVEANRQRQRALHERERQAAAAAVTAAAAAQAQHVRMMQQLGMLHHSTQQQQHQLTLQQQRALPPQQRPPPPLQHHRQQHALLRPAALASGGTADAVHQAAMSSVRAAQQAAGLPAGASSSDRSSNGRGQQQAQLQVQQQQQQQAAAVPGGADQFAPLLRRVVRLLRSRASQLRGQPLALAPTWLVRLGLADEPLLAALQEAAAGQLAEGAPEQLVPLLWGIAKTSEGAPRGSRAAGGQQARRGMVRQQGSERQHSMPTQQQQQQQHAPAVRPAPLQAGSAAPGSPPDASFVAAWLASSADHLASFSPSEAAASVYSLALLGVVPPPAWADAFWAASGPALAGSYSAQDLANTLWALGSLGLVPPGGSAGPWWGGFQAGVSRALWQLSGVGAANLVWGAARLGLAPSAQLGELLLWQAQRRLWEMDLRLLASLAWGVSRLGLAPRRFWLHRLCKRVSVLQGEQLTPGLGASLLLSLGALHHCPRAWMGRFLKALQPQLPAFTPQDVANSLTGLARLHYAPHPDWLFDFTLVLRRTLPGCGLRQLLPIAHALAVLSTNADLRLPPELLGALLAALRERLGDASAADCAALAQSLVHLRVAPGPALLDRLLARFLEGLAGAAGDDVATMLWAAGAFWRSPDACMWLRRHPGALAALVDAAGGQLAGYSPLSLKRALVGCAAMGLPPGQAWLAGHEAAVLAALPRLYPATLEQVLRGYRQLGYRPGAADALAGALRQKQAEAAARARARAAQQLQARAAGGGGGGGCDAGQEPGDLPDIEL